MGCCGNRSSSHVACPTWQHLLLEILQAFRVRFCVWGDISIIWKQIQNSFVSSFGSCHPSFLCLVKCLTSISMTWADHLVRSIEGFSSCAKKDVTYLCTKYCSKSTSCSNPPLFTLDTLLVILDTIEKHRTGEEFLFNNHCSGNTCSF